MLSKERHQTATGPGPWRNMQDLEMTTLGWVDWFNNRRLLGPMETSRQQRPKRTSMHSATCSIWSHEMKLKVSAETGAFHETPIASIPKPPWPSSAAFAPSRPQAAGPTECV